MRDLGQKVLIFATQGAFVLIVQVTHLFILLSAAQAHTLFRLLLLRYLGIFNEGGLFGGKLDLSKTALNELTRSFLVLRRAMGAG